LWSRTEIAAYGAAAPYALALIVIAAVPAWLLTWASEKSLQKPTDIDLNESLRVMDSTVMR